MQIDINFSPLSLKFTDSKNLYLSDVIPVFNDLGIKVSREEEKDNHLIFYISNDCCLNNCWLV